MKGLATKKTDEIVEEGKHLLGEFIGDAKGKTLIVFGSIHGNEIKRCEGDSASFAKTQKSAKTN